MQYDMEAFTESSATESQVRSRGSLTTMAVNRLRDLIVTGELKPGQRISERSILEGQKDLSRTPVREALKILESEGLIQLKPNRGAFITKLSIDHIDAEIELLIGLEGIAAVLSCNRITDAEIAEISRLHQAMIGSFENENLMLYFETNQRIHQLIVDGAHNPALSRIYKAECLHIRRYRYAGNLEHTRWHNATREHEQILAALMNRDGLLLRELLRAHHTNGWAVTRELLRAELE
jgi:DNA-binding GntR family transcriptional regulator